MTKVNEGFWDSVVNGVKRGALAVGAAAGSGKADGKLTALNLSTKLYDEYNRYLGSTGQKGSPNSMTEYMVNTLGFSNDFATRAGTEFERFLKSPATYPDQSSSSPMGNKAKNYSDGELRKYFLHVAQTALRTGDAKDAARAQLSSPQQSKPEDHPPENPAPEATPPASTAQAPAPAAEAEVSVQLQGANLNGKEQELLNSIEGQVGIEGLAGLVKADDPEVQKLAKKIFLQALRDYRAKHPEKTKKK